MSAMRHAVRGWGFAILVGALLVAGCEDIQVAGADDVVHADGGGGGGGEDSGGGGGDVGIDAGCQGADCPCQSDEECRTTGRGFFCEAGACTGGGDTDRFLLVVTVTGAPTVEAPDTLIGVALDETIARVDLDASASAYMGPGTPSYAWTVTDDAGLDVALDDGVTAHAWFSMPEILETAVLEFELVATDGSGEEAGAASATVVITVRNSVNEAPVVAVSAQPEEAVAGQQVVLDAVGSWDPNGDGLALPYQWEQTAGPIVPLTDASADGDWSVVAFLAPRVEADADLEFSARVSDDASPSAEGTGDVTVHVLAGDCDSHDECDDGNPCTLDTCGGDGLCRNAPAGDGTPCNDFDTCTTGDQCQGSVCRPGPPRVCPDDGNPCTRAYCADPEGCQTEPVDGGPCEDGDDCTSGDQCQEGECVGVPNPETCGCQSDADCPDDGNLCNGIPFCDPTAEPPACRRRPGSIVVCPSLPGDCEVNVCNPGTGECVSTAAPSGTPCNDDLVCTVNDACAGVSCRGSVPDCADTDPCTDDSCSEESGGCVHQRIDGCCSGPLDCEDWDPCTSDECDGNACIHIALPGCCGSDQDCLPDGQCVQNQCVFGGTCTSPADCDDGSSCTEDICEPSGTCANPPRPVGAVCGSDSSVPITTDFHGGLCDADGACQPFARALYPERYSQGEGAWGLNALWQATTGTTLWAAGWYGSTEAGGGPNAIPVILGAEGGVFGGEVFRLDANGALMDIAGGLAVGHGGVAILDAGRWNDVGFEGWPRSGFGHVAGLKAPNGMAGAWYASSFDGMLYACLGDNFNLMGVGWVCTPETTVFAQSDPAGPLWASITGLVQRDDLEAHAWYAVNDVQGGKPIWYGYRSATMPLTTWSTDPPGCDPYDMVNRGGCQDAGTWRDIFGTGTAGNFDLWAVGDRGTLLRLPPRAETWEQLRLTAADLGGHDPRSFQWTGVWASGPHVFVAGTYDGCFAGVCRDGVQGRSLVLLHHDVRADGATGVVLLDEAQCDDVTSPDIPGCMRNPITPAAVNDVWGVVRNGRVQVFVGGAWPAYENGIEDDIRATLYSIEFTGD